MCSMTIQLTPMNWNKARWSTALNQLTIEKHNDNECRTIINPLSRLQNPNLCVFMNFDKCETILIVSQFDFRSDQPSSSEFESFQLNAIQSNSILFSSNFIFFIIHWFNVFFSLFVDFSINFFFFSNFCWISSLFFCHRIKILAESCIWIPNYFSDFQVRVSWLFSLYLGFFRMFSFFAFISTDLCLLVCIGRHFKNQTSN